MSVDNKADKRASLTSLVSANPLNSKTFIFDETTASWQSLSVQDVAGLEADQCVDILPDVPIGTVTIASGAAVGTTYTATWSAPAGFVAYIQSISVPAPPAGVNVQVLVSTSRSASVPLLATPATGAVSITGTEYHARGIRAVGVSVVFTVTTSPTTTTPQPAGTIRGALAYKRY